MKTAGFIAAFLFAVSALWSQDGKRPDDELQKKEQTYLGVYVAPVDEVLVKQLQLKAGIGLVVRSVTRNSPAAQAGIERCDILMSMDEQLLINSDQFAALIRLKKSGDKVTFKLRRAGKEVAVDATLKSRTVTVHQSRLPRWIPETMKSGQTWSRSLEMPEGKVEFDMQINKLFGDTTLNDKEKAGRINEMLRNHGFNSMTVTINGNKIDLSKPSGKAEASEKAPRKTVEATIKESLEMLPKATRKRIEEQLKDKDGKFKTNIRILQTPHGPVYIIESTSIQFRSERLYRGA